jgi:hypothetical protein
LRDDGDTPVDRDDETGGLRGLARRNLVAGGAGALLVAVLGTVVTLGATSDSDAEQPSSQVGVNPSASQGADDGSLGADVPKNDDPSDDTGTATSRPTDPGPDGTLGTSDDPTPTDSATPSDDPSGTQGPSGGPSTSPKPSTTKPPTSPNPSQTSPSKPPSTSVTPTPTTTPTGSATTTPTQEPSTTPSTSDSASGPASSPVESSSASAGAPETSEAAPPGSSGPVI